MHTHTSLTVLSDLSQYHSSVTNASPKFQLSPAHQEMDGSKRMPRGRVSPVVVLAVVMAVVASLPSQHQCSRAASKPDLNDIEAKNAAHAKGQVVANMAGYLELLGNSTTHYLLNVRSIYNAKYAGDHSRHSLVMYDDHAHLRISYHKNEEADSYEFTKMEVTIDDGASSVSSYKEICEFDEQFAFSLPADLRYSCKEAISHQCSHKGKPVANFVLKSFEIELGADEDKLVKREFSKPAWDESCDHWPRSSSRGIGSERDTHSGWGICIFVTIIVIVIIIIIIVIKSDLWNKIKMMS